MGFTVTIDMSDAPPEREQTQSPVEPLYTHPASPFMRTESNLPPVVSDRPAPPPRPVQSTWITYRAQIEIGLALLAYMMFLVGSVTIVRANPDASWRYVVAVVPVAPAALVLILFARRLSHLDELQKRIQIEAFGFSLAATALVTFALRVPGGRRDASPQLDLHPAPDGGPVGGGHRHLHVPVSVKNRLRVLRAELDWSQADLAVRLGVSRQTVNAIETGKYDPSLPLAFSLARTFKRRIEEIFDAEPVGVGKG